MGAGKALSSMLAIMRDRLRNESLPLRDCNCGRRSAEGEGEGEQKESLRASRKIGQERAEPKERL